MPFRQQESGLTNIRGSANGVGGERHGEAECSAELRGRRAARGGLAPPGRGGAMARVGAAHRSVEVSPPGELGPTSSGAFRIKGLGRNTFRMSAWSRPTGGMGRRPTRGADLLRPAAGWSKVPVRSPWDLARSRTRSRRFRERSGRVRWSRRARRLVTASLRGRPPPRASAPRPAPPMRSAGTPAALRSRRRRVRRSIRRPNCELGSSNARRNPQPNRAL